MDKKKYIIDNNINYNEIPEEQFIEYYGSPLDKMLQFGYVGYVENDNDALLRFSLYLEAVKTDEITGFYEELYGCIGSVTDMHEIYLISKDLDGDVFLLKESFNSVTMEVISVISKKHKMRYEISQAALDIKFTQIWFYPSK